MDAVSERTGGCACGGVRYRLTSEPLIVHCCHCLNCQRQTESAFVINAVIDALSHLGVTDIQMPASPERVWRAIEEAKQ